MTCRWFHPCSSSKQSSSKLLFNRTQWFNLSIWTWWKSLWFRTVGTKEIYYLQIIGSLDRQSKNKYSLRPLSAKETMRWLQICRITSIFRGSLIINRFNPLRASTTWLKNTTSLCITIRLGTLWPSTTQRKSKSKQVRKLETAELMLHL